ncbi:Acyl-CoA dehydrogenase/oxidase C-terminal [Syntrophomonas zehnderi OL-4]|uniref:Acyl-CoA dehydrogenase/oxidase C-terminal n=1 Tax=Syntrophomonas zehnderi OL-4 TaxID=690567 RepID=A0A0E4CKQ0_9FIRM|nr:acyl-CoA dehydrogenase [Syntrophomonas zehnderi]CQB51962.1 Acyl-CoA dehydrogenase/oxidase C-terminal [Syntrophomonas zehnderi OL-4]
MSYKYAYNTRDIKFILKEWLPLDDVLSWDRYKDYYSKDDVDVLVDQVRKVAEEIVAPTADDADKIGARWEDGKVYLPPSFHGAIKFLQEQGWGASTFDFEAEGGIPLTIYFLLWEMLSAANPGMMSYVSNGGAVANVIYHYAQDYLKEMFLPDLYAGTWGGSMCLTEPSVGSDVGGLLTKAIPTDDPRIYKIKGQKIFITVGDRDDIDQVVHLVLARVEGAAPGTKGLSLFITPKLWVNEDGSLTPNDVQTAGIEHKLGLKGSATCQLVFGEENNCRGWLMGPAPDENGVGMGIVQMFNMMNEARLDTGRLALAVTANAYWNAKDYGKDRVQGNLLSNPKAGKVSINQHEDVKRMYLLNKATTEACRALLAKCYYYEDAREFAPTPEKRKWAQDKLDMLTPLCKAYPSDEAWGLIAESLQSYGGYGYCEDYPAANSARDCKIWSIWEGTNYIQALDLIGRKWMQKKGTLFAGILGEIDEFLAENKGKLPGLEQEMAHLEKALGAYRQTQMAIGKYVQSGKVGLMATYARRILTATAQLYCGYLLLDQAKIALARMEELGSDHYDYNFYLGKIFSTRYYLNNAVPNVWHTLELVQIGDTSCMEAPVEIFEY